MLAIGTQQPHVVVGFSLRMIRWLCCEECRFCCVPFAGCGLHEPAIVHRWLCSKSRYRCGNFGVGMYTSSGRPRPKL
uniref:Uncharacterized protein n=1 Tax=Arundo donax TaxID=35708 RepID=A0A0A8ZB64_ARUDO